MEQALGEESKESGRRGDQTTMIASSSIPNLLTGRKEGGGTPKIGFGSNL